MRIVSLLISVALLCATATPSFAIEVPETAPRKRVDRGPIYTLGFDIWYINNNGFVQVEGGDRIVIPRDAELGKGSNVFPLQIQVERIGPYIPNFRLHGHRYSYESRLKHSRNTNFAKVDFFPGSKVLLDVYAVGLLAFYTSNPWDRLELQYGFELRRFGGQIGMAGEDPSIRALKEVKYDITSKVVSYLPLFHGGISYRFAHPDVRFGLEGEGLKLGDYAYYDARALISYTLFGVNLGAGYRHSYFGGKERADGSNIGMHAKGTFVRFSIRL